MIVLDTHIWVWWVHDPTRLSARQAQILTEKQTQGLAVSVNSCWEIAMLSARGRLDLGEPVENWIAQALTPSRVHLLDLTPRIAVESTQLPGEFHRDPADQIIVSTARVHGYALLTADQKILDYSHVEILRQESGEIIETTTEKLEWACYEDVAKWMKSRFYCFDSAINKDTPD